MQRIFETPEMRISVFDSRDAIVTESTGTTAKDMVKSKLKESHEQMKNIIVLNW